MKSKEAMKSKEVLLVGVFVFSLLFLMIGVIIGSRASPPPSVGAMMPPGPISTMQMPAGGATAAVPPAVLAHQAGRLGRLDYTPPAP